MANDHSGLTITVWSIIKDVMTFVADTTANEDLSSRFTLMVMNDLEFCFQIDPDSTGGLIGNESLYTYPQLSLVADLVGLRFLLSQSITNTSASGSSASTYLKKAKAGSAETEFGLVGSSSSGITMNVTDMWDKLSSSAISKGANMGCIFDVCSDCSVKAVSCDLLDASILPFVTGGNCCD